MATTTSSITTSTNGDLTINPNGSGKIVLTKLAGSGERPVGTVNADGEVHAFDHRNLPRALETLDTDLVMVQRGAGYLAVGSEDLRSAKVLESIEQWVANNPDSGSIQSFTEFAPSGGPTASLHYVNYPLDDKYGTATATWKDGRFEIQSYGLLFSVNGGSFDQLNKIVEYGDQVVVGYIDGIPSGKLCNLNKTLEIEFELAPDTEPSAFSFEALIDQAPNSEVVSMYTPVLGINSPTSITAITDGPNALSSVGVSVNDSAFSSTFPITFNPGDKLRVRGTTGGLNDTTYSANLAIGGVDALISFTTGSTGDLVQPLILNPGNADGLDQETNVTITGSSIERVDGVAATHNDSTWQIYKVIGSGGLTAPPTTEPPAASDFTLHEESAVDTANLLSWSPTTPLDSGSKYFVRVKYASSGPTVTSEYSPWSGFQTK